MSQAPSRLHEVSVVVGLRDWQWKNRDAEKYPNLGVNLDGRPEKKLGDTIIRDGERLYLFEVKSTRATIHEEWNTIWGERKLKPKHAHRKLADELTEFGRHSRSDPFEVLHQDTHAEHVYQSLACHYFAFWPTESENPGAICDRVWTESYLLSTAKQNGFLKTDLINNGLKELKKYRIAESLSPLNQSDDDDISYRVMNFASLDMIHDRSARIVGTIQEEGKIRSKWRHLGLELEQFQKYVDFLCGNDDEEIYAVIMSSQGSVFAHSSKTSDLKSMVAAFITSSAAALKARPEPEVKAVELKKFRKSMIAKSSYASAAPGSDPPKDRPSSQR